MKQISLIFVVALVLNALWENLHSFLYVNYMGGTITEFILLRASLFDAFLIIIISIPFIYFSFLKNKTWLIIIFGILIAILNEWYGLQTGRWMYSEFMPIIPILKTGLSPTLQLGVLGHLSFKFSAYILRVKLITPQS